MSAAIGAFEKLIGEKASPDEVRRLCEIKDALGIGDNDALWLILIALERYDALYREYPGRIARAAEEALELVRKGSAFIAAAETKRAERRLAEMVAVTAMKIAKEQAQTAWMDGFCVAGVAVALIGGFGVFVGYHRGSGGRTSPWASGPSGPAQIASALLGAPAGWTAVLFLVPLAARWAKSGWRAARADEAPRTERLYGWTLMLLATGAVLAVMGMLWKVL